MSAKLASNPLSAFQCLGNGILLHKPPEQSSAPPASAPSLIIITTWFAALPHQIAKYISTYQTLYPEACLLVLQSSVPDMLYRSYATQQTHLLPCIAILQEHTKTPQYSILLHIFSNSGAHTACQLAHAYRSQAGTALPLGAMILDSAPATGKFRTMSQGFTAGLPSTTMIGKLLSLVVYGLIGAIILKETILGEENFVEKLRRDLNDAEVLTAKRGRLYIYSREDKVVDWVDVESHARDAEEKAGGKEGVRLERWVGSGHVAHRGKDSKRYWDVITKLWEEIDDKEMGLKSQL